MQRDEVFKKSSASRVVAGGAWQIVATIIGGALIFLWIILGGRPPPLGYGPEGFEFFLTANALLIILNAPSFGLSQAAVKFISETLARDKKRANEIASQAAGAIIFTGILVFIFLLLFISLVRDPADRFSFMIVALVIPFMYLRDVVNSVIGAVHRFDYLGIIAGILGVVTFLAGIFFLLNFKGMENARYLAMIPLVATIAMFFSAILFFKICSPFSFPSLLRERLDLGFARSFLPYGGFCLLANLAAFGITLQISLFSVKLMSMQNFIFNDTLVGVYGVSTIYAWIVMFITFMSFPLVPEVSRAKELGDKKLLDEVIKAMLKFSFALGTIIIAMFAVFAEMILLTFNGEEYVILGGKSPLILAVAGMVFYAVSSIFGAILVGSGHARYAGLSFGFGTLLMVTLTPFLSIPLGLAGPALSLLISGIFVLPLVMWKVKMELGARYPSGVFIRPVVSAAPLALIFGFFVPGFIHPERFIYSIGIIFAFAGILILAYTILLVWVGNYEREDYEMIEDTLTSFGMRPVGKLITFSLKIVHRASPFSPPL
jgi:O-antigen/teichoic acid export membrane protein